jgi:3-deoxy-manno-octulosonate cytidylyltransferase (CMP-KDO synthetase)
LAGQAQVFVATDDAAIADVVRGFGQVVMTSPDCRNGTERCAQAVAALGLTEEIVVNLQGDAPLTPPHVVAGIARAGRGWGGGHGHGGDAVLPDNIPASGR